MKIDPAFRPTMRAIRALLRDEDPELENLNDLDLAVCAELAERLAAQVQRVRQERGATPPTEPEGVKRGRWEILYGHHHTDGQVRACLVREGQPIAEYVSSFEPTTEQTLESLVLLLAGRVQRLQELAEKLSAK